MKPYSQARNAADSSRRVHMYKFLLFVVGLLVVLGSFFRKIVYVAPIIPVYAFVLQNFRTISPLIAPEPALVGQFQRLFSKNFYISFAIYALVAAAFFQIMAPAVVYEVEFVAVPEVPLGLPADIHISGYGDLRFFNAAFGMQALTAVLLAFVQAWMLVELPIELSVQSPYTRLKIAVPSFLKLAGKLAVLGVCLPAVYWFGPVFIIKGFFSVFCGPFKSQRHNNLWSYMVCVLMVLPLVLFFAFAVHVVKVYCSYNSFSRGRPLSAASQDANGTLCEGLRSSDLESKLLAWSELVKIAKWDESRRKNIFNDADGDRVIWKDLFAEGSREWTEMAKHLEELGKDVEKEKIKAKEKLERERIDAKLQSLQSQSHSHSQSQNSGQSQNSSQIPHTQDYLERLLSAKVTEEVVLRPETKDLLLEVSESRFNRVVKGNEAREPAGYIQKLSGMAPGVCGTLKQSLSAVKTAVYTSKLGYFTRKTMASEIKRALPNLVFTELSLEAISLLEVASLKDDPYGYVQEDIARTLEELRKLKKLIKLVYEKPCTQWLDVNVQRGLSEPDYSVLLSLESCIDRSLDAITAAFKPYFESLGVKGN